MRHLFFNNCLICGSDIASGEILCSFCREKLDNERLSSFMSRCPECHYPSFGTEYNCRNCARENPMPIYSLMDYSGTYCKAIIEKFKFYGDKSFAPLVGSYISECIDILNPDGAACIVSVPCSVSSLKKRGWDQMKLVCRYIKRRCINAVVNVSESETQQKTLDKDDREALASERYAINTRLSDKEREYLLSHKVVIVDDIMTTGATLYAVASVLRNLGCSDVCAATWLCEL